jgi:hypothetical protein
VATNAQAGASVQADGGEVTWTSDQNADFLAASVFGCDQSVERLDEVGDSATFTGCSGGVDVTVTAYSDDGDSTVIVTAYSDDGDSTVIVTAYSDDGDSTVIVNKSFDV